MVVLRVAVFVAFVGLCLMVWAEKMLVGVRTLLPLFVTREGKLLLALGVALLVCTGAVVAVDLWPRRWSLWLLGAAGSAAMLVHVLAGHAMSPVSAAPLSVALQWVHLTAIGVWVGGLFWLLLGLRGCEGAERSAAVGRFTRVATVDARRGPGDGACPGALGGGVDRRPHGHRLRECAAHQDRSGRGSSSLSGRSTTSSGCRSWAAATRAGRGGSL